MPEFCAVSWGHVPGGPAQIAAADRGVIITLQPGGDGEHDTVGGAWALRVAGAKVRGVWGVVRAWMAARLGAG